MSAGIETVSPREPRSIASQAQFVAAVCEAAASATRWSARRMLWCDGDFADWPLDDPVLLQHLSQWLKLPRRELVLVARRFDLVSARCPRFMAWYRVWNHAVLARSPDEDDSRDLPCVLVIEGGGVLHLVDALHWRGQFVLDRAEERLWCERLDALLQRCAPALPVTTLGI